MKALRQQQATAMHVSRPIPAWCSYDFSPTHKHEQNRLRLRDVRGLDLSNYRDDSLWRQNKKAPADWVSNSRRRHYSVAAP